MKILAIGHSILDHFEGQEEIIKPGGLYYTSLGLTTLKRRDDRVYLLTGINESFRHLFEKAYNNCELVYSNELDDLPEVFLKLKGLNEREEIYKNISQPLKIESIEDWNIFDGILINMITGFDITIEQLKYVREQYSKLIYFDVHTLSRGLDEMGNREFRPIPRIEEWLDCIDILQCNENEIQCLYNGEESEIAKRILGSGVKMLILTKGRNGADIYWDSSDLQKLHQDAVEVEEKNSIGCGDIFGATFFYSYILGDDISTALEKSIVTAANVVNNKFFVNG
jgi:adenosine kinase